MDKQPEADMNGKAKMNGKGPYSRLNGSRIPPRVPPRIPSRRTSPLLPATVFCLAVTLLVALATQNFKQMTTQTAPSGADAFRLAVNRAMSAAELTQTALSREEWGTVADWWKEAVELMKTVPMSSPNYQLAQQKAQEYERNLQYAQDRGQTPAKQASPSDGLWTAGSRRADVLRIQGKPTETDRYDSLCKEVLHYGKSNVELSNGIVVNYEDFDKKLKVAPDGSPLPPPPTTDSHWTLGSSREDVFKRQGTPSRIDKYDYSKRELLYYGNSFVELTDNRVTGYNNFDGNLNASIVPLSGTATSDRPYWTLNSERDDIFRIQGTPTEVSLDNAQCSEVFHYGDSTVELTNGFISGYDNIGGNLKVKAK
jgi:hypothetical protein